VKEEVATPAFEPRIIAFCCSYCAYRAADLAGTSRMQYPPNVKVIRVPCSSKVDITYILRAFESGADGVFIAGCLKGGCHFVEGNLKAEQRVMFTKGLLDAVGIEAERLDMFFMSSSMANTLVNTMNLMIDRIRKLGPLPRKWPSLTQKSPDISKREFLFQMLKNMRLKAPEKPVPVPPELEEFGRIECNLAACIGCKRCGEVCPEKAIDFKIELDLPLILQNIVASKQERVTKRHMLYETLAKIAVKPSSRIIQVPNEMDEFCKLQYNPKKCVICEKCANICPERAIKIVKELDLPVILS